MTDSTGAAEAAPAAGCAQLRFVLVEPSHVGNIGACARALRAMGFERLAVVRPRDVQFRAAPQALALAAAAAPVLAQAEAFDSLAQALHGVELAIATTGYARERGAEPIDVRRAAQRAAAAARGDGAQVAFIFGPERTGLANADVQRCHACCHIPSDPVYGSLNLAQALQVVAYECRRELFAHDRRADPPAPRRDATQAAPRERDPEASVEQTEAMFEHLAGGLAAIGYLDPQEPRHLMARLRALLLRAQPTTVEVDILRGIAAAMTLPRRLRAGRKLEPE